MPWHHLTYYRASVSCIFLAKWTLGLRYLDLLVALKNCSRKVKKVLQSQNTTAYCTGCVTLQYPSVILCSFQLFNRNDGKLRLYKLIFYDLILNPTAVFYTEYDFVITSYQSLMNEIKDLNLTTYVTTGFEDVLVTTLPRNCVTTRSTWLHSC